MSNIHKIDYLVRLPLSYMPAFWISVGDGRGIPLSLEFRGIESYPFPGSREVSLLFILSENFYGLKKMSPLDAGMWILESRCAFCCDSSDYMWDLQKPRAMPTSSSLAPAFPIPLASSSCTGTALRLPGSGYAVLGKLSRVI